MGDNFQMSETSVSTYSFISRSPDPLPKKHARRKQGMSPALAHNSANPLLLVPKTYGTLLEPNHAIQHNSQSPPQRKISRAVTKTGCSNVTPTNIQADGFPFLADTFTTLLEVSWTWTLSVFVFSYFGSWLCFAGIWYLIGYCHGDLDPINVHNDSWRPCISGMKDFTSAFLFSVETQHTTGYGYYHLTEECAAAVINLCIQSIFGVIMEGILVGLVFVKMSRAKSRSATLMFSRNSVISQRQGELCFMFRVADMRKSHLLDVSVRAQLIKRSSVNGEEVTISQEELQVNGEGEKDNRLLLFWPTIVIHRINRKSPLYRLAATDLTPDNTKFEIIVVLEGIVEATGLTTQARSSYMPSEILWGKEYNMLTLERHRFKSITSMKCKTGERVIDFSMFHEVFPVPTSPLSAYQIDTLSTA